MSGPRLRQLADILTQARRGSPLTTHPSSESFQTPLLSTDSFGSHGLQCDTGRIVGMLGRERIKVLLTSLSPPPVTSAERSSSGNLAEKSDPSAHSQRDKTSKQSTKSRTMSTESMEVHDRNVPVRERKSLPRGDNPHILISITEGTLRISCRPAPVMVPRDATLDSMMLSPSEASFDISPSTVLSSEPDSKSCIILSEEAFFDSWGLNSTEVQQGSFNSVELVEPATVCPASPASALASETACRDGPPPSYSEKPTISYPKSARPALKCRGSSFTAEAIDSSHQHMLVSGVTRRSSKPSLSRKPSLSSIEYPFMIDRVLTKSPQSILEECYDWEDLRLGGGMNISRPPSWFIKASKRTNSLVDIPATRDWSISELDTAQEDFEQIVIKTAASPRQARVECVEQAPPWPPVLHLVQPTTTCNDTDEASRPASGVPFFASPIFDDCAGPVTTSEQSPADIYAMYTAGMEKGCRMAKLRLDCMKPVANPLYQSFKPFFDDIPNLTIAPNLGTTNELSGYDNDVLSFQNLTAEVEASRLTDNFNCTTSGETLWAASLLSKPPFPRARGAWV